MNPWIDEAADWLGPGRRRRDPEGEIPGALPEGEKLVAVWVPILCPRCRGRDVPVTRTDDREHGLRWHKCRTCGSTFRSVERIPSFPDSGR